MQDQEQNSFRKNMLQENGRSCFFAINIISIFFTVSQFFSQQQEGQSKFPMLITLAYHSLNIYAAYNLNLQLIKIQKIVSICFGVLHSIGVLILVFFLIAVIFGKSDNQNEDNKFLAFILMLCLTIIISLILLIDILNYKYFNQLIISLENREQAGFANSQYQLNQQLINPLQTQQFNQVELRDYESQNQRQP
ncbi:hypothetical protein ABPG74_022510 [Tetrahymena malaccensis]